MYVRVEYPKIQCFDNDGNLAIDYQVFTYAAGTSTPQTTYSDRLLTAENTNPIILNARGEADIFTNVNLKLVFTIPDGDPNSPIWTQDYVTEQQEYYLHGEATPVTVNNHYIVDIELPPQSLVDNLTIAWVPDIDNTDTMGSVAHGGTGFKNDCTFSGPYIGTTSGSTFRVEIDGAGSPNTIKWRKDSGAWTENVAITGSRQPMIEDVYFKFQELEGHEIGDYWVLTVYAPATLNLNDLGQKIIYKNLGGTLTALSGGDIKAGIPAICIYSELNNCWELVNTADPVLEALEPVRPRLNISTDFNLIELYHGWELNFIHTTGTKTLTLCPAIQFADKFVYVRAGSTGHVAIVPNSSDELIYGPLFPDGTMSYPVGGGAGENVQIATNGVNWHVMTETCLQLQRIFAVNEDHTLVITDNDKEISMENSAAQKTVHLLPAADFKNKTVTITAATNQNVTIAASGTEKIYGPRATSGAITYPLYGNQRDCVTISSDGTSWHVLTETYHYVPPLVANLSMTVTVYWTPGNYTWTKNGNTDAIRSECYGGGGGGAGVSGAWSSGGYPGAGGGYSMRMTAGASITSKAIVVGGGGAGGSYAGPTDGSAGGDSYFGDIHYATGGQGGQAYSFSIVPPEPGVGVRGTVDLYGQTCLLGYVASTGDLVTVAGGRGAGPLGGGGGVGRVIESVASSQTGYDLGGGGSNVPFEGYANGGQGGHGAVIVTEYTLFYE